MNLRWKMANGVAGEHGSGPDYETVSADLLTHACTSKCSRLLQLLDAVNLDLLTGQVGLNAIYKRFLFGLITQSV